MWVFDYLAVYRKLPISVHCSLHLQICEKIGCSEELSEVKCSTVTESHFCNKSVSEISLLDIPLSTVRGIIGNWKHVGTEAIQPWYVVEVWCIKVTNALLIS